MVDLLWFVLTLILLAVENAAHRYPRDAYRIFAAQL